MEKEYIMELKNISKSFPGVQALNNVSMQFERGKVHALVGENGAGKSTLMKIIMGLYRADQGQIFIKGEKFVGSSVIHSLQAGVKMIHQELNFIPFMSVAENIFLGHEPCNNFLGVVSKKKLLKETKKLLDRVNLDVNPNLPMRDLTVAERQMVEIAKSVSFGADIIIMDEPTSAISETEVKRLFEIIEELKRKGVAIIYISHKLDEVYQISDSISVLRDGNYIATFKTAEIEQDKLIKAMVGRELENIYPDKRAKIGEEMLKIENLSKDNVFTDISFSVNKGEILGVAGMMGSGRTEVMNCIFGLDKYDSGQIYIRGENVSISNPNKAIQKGIGMVHEDRKETGLILGLSVKENITLSNLDKIFSGQIINKQKENIYVDDIVEKLSIKTPHRDQQVKFLSGGNQQKIVIGRILLDQADIIILDEPTRGIDVGAKTEIYKLIVDLAAQGKAIIMVSSEMNELIGMSDRIIILREGHKVGELDKANISQEKIIRRALLN
ncbi:MAG: sugar ABC transporter ATP-binding protein [Clostridiaceae bacterium]|nr:sugar ABC transporter ATP-binding protein [Clostridiaceae bacterium]